MEDEIVRCRARGLVERQRIQGEYAVRSNRRAADLDAASGVVVQLLRRDFDVWPAGARVDRELRKVELTLNGADPSFIVGRQRWIEQEARLVAEQEGRQVVTRRKEASNRGQAILGWGEESQIGSTGGI